MSYVFLLSVRHIGIIFHIGSMPIFTFKALSTDISPILSCIPTGSVSAGHLMRSLWCSLVFRGRVWVRERSRRSSAASGGSAPITERSTRWTWCSKSWIKPTATTPRYCGTNPSVFVFLFMSSISAGPHGSLSL